MRLGWVVTALGATLCLAARPSRGEDLDAARALHREGRLAEALTAYRGVIDAATVPDDVATAANNACVLLSGTDRYEEAIDLCRLALDIRRELRDARLIGRTLNNLGLALQQTGATAAAEAAFREALEINRRGDDAEGAAANLTNLGMLTAAQGRYEESLTYQERAVSLADGRPAEPWSAVYRTTNLINRGVVLEKLGAFLEALRLYTEIENGKGLDPGRRAAVWANMATLYRNLGDPVQALERLDRAAGVYAELGHQAALSNVHLNRGLTLWHNYRDAVRAEAAFRRALELARRTGDRIEEVQDLYSLGSMLVELGRLDEAQALLAQCLTLAEEAGSTEGRWSALEGLGRTARRRGDPAAALGLFRQAMTLIEGAREDLEAGKRGQFFASKRAAFEAAAEILAERAAAGDAAAAGAALAVAHRAKARDLLDTLGHPGEGSGLAAVEAIQARLRDGLLLEYLVTPRRILRWVVGVGSIEVDDLGASDETLGLVERVHELLEVGKEPPAAALAALSATLLGGLDRRGYPHWTIAPDRLLHYLPFELLALPTGPRERLLVDVAEVSYLPSGAVLGAPRPTGTVAALGLVGFGDPSPAHGRALAALGARFDLGSLPGARDELAAAAGEMPGGARVLLGPAASEAALRDLPPGGASVVHLAAHTLLDESSTRGPAIVLSAGGGEDGLVHPSELAGRPFGGRLAVLAGCQTALGGEADGRALASLTGALLGAGAEGVVATLWRVNDEATAAFMEQFYYYLGRGKSPAAALRLAKLRLRASVDWGRPDFWGGFVLAGGGGALVAPPSDRLSRLAALGAAVALLAGMAWRSRASRRRRH